MKWGWGSSAIKIHSKELKFYSKYQKIKPRKQKADDLNFIFSVQSSFEFSLK